MNNLSKRLKPNIGISREIVGEIEQLEDELFLARAKNRLHEVELHLIKIDLNALENELASVKNKLRLAKYELANLKNE